MVGFLRSVHCSPELKETVCWVIAVLVCHIQVLVADLVNFDAIHTICCLALPRKSTRCRQYAAVILHKILEYRQIRYLNPKLVSIVLMCNLEKM
jgi:hypothetical protein